MKRVLVTGGAGFIGSHLCDRLLERGCDLIVLDDFSSGNERNLAHIASRITVIRDDVRNVLRHKDALQGVDTVFHFAALISGHDSLHDPDAYLDVNVRGTMEVLRLCKALHRPRLLFASSSTVYGQSSEVMTRRESDVPEPLTVYAMSKIAGEHLIRMYAGLYGYEAVALRLFNVFGPRQSPTHPYANVTCKFSHAAANGLGVKLYGSGEQSRDFVYVDDVVAAFLAVAEGADEPFYNVGSGQNTSIADLLRIVQEVADRKLDVEQMPPWPNDIRAIRADVERIRTEFKLPEPTPLHEGLRRTVAFFRAPHA
jgi:nucleoside-diphosphate-sugar epimerase